MNILAIKTVDQNNLLIITIDAMRIIITFITGQFTCK